MVTAIDCVASERMEFNTENKGAQNENGGAGRTRTSNQTIISRLL
jgi:hypothetical protein